MSNLLAGIYSKADSLKRALNNAISEPLGYARQTIGYGVDRLNENTRDMNEANSQSVLVSKEQKAAANKRVTDRTVDQLAGAGIIVPAKAFSPTLVKTAEKMIGEKQALAAYRQTGIYEDPVDKILKMVIPDNKRTFSGLESISVVRPKPVTDIMYSDDLPGDLKKLMDQTLVVGQKAPGAYYSAQGDMIGMGPTSSVKEAKSQLLHEVQHGSQYMYDMSRGGNPDFFFEDFAKFQNARAILDTASEGMMKNLKESDIQAGFKPKGPNQLRYEDRRQLLSDPASISSLQNFLRIPREKAYDLYSGLPGEVESRLVQKQFELGDYTTHPLLLRDKLTSEMTTDPKNAPKVDSDFLTQTILNKILGYGE